MDPFCSNELLCAHPATISITKSFRHSLGVTTSSSSAYMRTNYRETAQHNDVHINSLELTLSMEFFAAFLLFHNEEKFSVDVHA